MKDYLQSAFLAISAVKFAEVVNWLPEPETAAQAAVLALLSGFIGAAGKGLFEWIKTKVRS